MSYDDAVSHVVDVVEGVGAGIMVVGALVAFLRFAQHVRGGTERAYQQLREGVGRVILLGLEVLIIADIIRTIVVEPSLESVAVLDRRRLAVAPLARHIRACSRSPPRAQPSFGSSEAGPLVSVGRNRTTVYSRN